MSERGGCLGCAKGEGRGERDDDRRIVAVLLVLEPRSPTPHVRTWIPNPKKDAILDGTPPALPSASRRATLQKGKQQVTAYRYGIATGCNATYALGLYQANHHAFYNLALPLKSASIVRLVILHTISTQYQGDETRNSLAGVTRP